MSSAATRARRFAELLEDAAPGYASSGESQHSRNAAHGRMLRFGKRRDENRQLVGSLSEMIMATTLSLKRAMGTLPHAQNERARQRVLRTIHNNRMLLSQLKAEQQEAMRT